VQQGCGVTQFDPDDDTFDYVIVGGGTAGALLANRLTDDSNATVCVLEAGPPDRHPFIHIPAGFIKMLGNPAYTWNFSTEPAEATDGRSIPATQGRVLGGSSSINGMIYNRGQHADYDHWAQLGNHGWGYADILPYFKRSERRIGGGDDRFRGRDGNLVVTDSAWRNPICDAFIAAAESLGIPRNPDYNGASQAGVGYMQRAINRGYRWSSARAFLRPARNRRTLEIRTHARALKVLCNGKRAIGVQYADDRNRTRQRSVFARREIILSSGTINTARLLQLSGIGSGGLMQELGLSLQHELPGVGENFRDHYCVRLVARAKGVTTINELSHGLRLGGEVARWVLGRPSILSLSPSVMHLFWKSNEALDAPDLQGVFSPASYKQGIVADLDHFPGMTLGFYQQRPESVGYVRIRSPDPLEQPAIQPNYLSSSYDRRVLLAGLRLGRRVLGAAPLAPYMAEETLPGPDVASDDELLDYARRYGSTVYHFTGTARMGPRSDATAVVDDQLRVHGMEGLRVVDASVMPAMPSGNTCVPVLMIAEKAADMIRGRAPVTAAEDIPVSG
jgi:choline dehydrogenase